MALNPRWPVDGSTGISTSKLAWRGPVWLAHQSRNTDRPCVVTVPARGPMYTACRSSTSVQLQAVKQAQLLLKLA